MSNSDDYDVEAAIGVESGASNQEHVTQGFGQGFVPPSVGFSEQGVQNRGRKGFRAPKVDRMRNHQSFYDLQHRYTNLITCPCAAILIGILVTFILFQGFRLYPSANGVADKVSSSGDLPASDHAKSAVDNYVDGTNQGRLFSAVVVNNYTGVGRAGMVFRRRVLDTLQGILWPVRTVHHFYLLGRT